MRKRLPSFLSIGFVALIGAQLAFAGEQCPSPRAGFPALSFGMTGISGSQCKTQLDRARWLGFTSVSLSPTFYVQSNGTVKPKENSADLISCFDYAKSVGFDIIYKPMIEAQNQPHQSSAPASSPNPTLGDKLLETSDQSKTLWRAWMDFTPGTDYSNQVMEPFLNWLETHDVKNSALKASIVVATELHRSIVDHPKNWNNLMWGMRQRIQNSGLKDRVQVGIDPSTFGRESWLPSELRRMLSSSECADYQAMLWTADFYAGSVYGDYIQAGFNKDPQGAIQKMSDVVESRWKNSLSDRGCRLTKGLVKRYENAEYQGRDLGRSTKVTWSGEIGYGGSLTHSYSGFETDPPYSHPEKMDQYRHTTLISEQVDFQRNAPVWLKAVLDNARGSYRDSVNFWITGRFDIFGFGDFPPLGDLDSKEGQYTAKDPVRGADQIPAVAQIRDLLQSYTRDRCLGWQPLLPKAPVAPTATKVVKKVIHRHRKPKPVQAEGMSIEVNATTDEIHTESSTIETLIPTTEEPAAQPEQTPDSVP